MVGRPHGTLDYLDHFALYHTAVPTELDGINFSQNFFIKYDWF
jgi:hypothetical protein